MSGVVFTAADFHRTLLTTNVGAIPEYLEKNMDSFICENDDESLAHSINEALLLPSDVLQQMGNNLFNNINSKYNWETIGTMVVETIYKH